MHTIRRDAPVTAIHILPERRSRKLPSAEPEERHRGHPPPVRRPIRGGTASEESEDPDLKSASGE